MDQFTRQATELLRQRDLAGMRRAFRKNGVEAEGTSNPVSMVTREGDQSRKLGPGDQA
jgi:hypothetical protein